MKNYGVLDKALTRNTSLDEKPCFEMNNVELLDNPKHANHKLFKSLWPKVEDYLGEWI